MADLSKINIETFDLDRASAVWKRLLRLQEFGLRHVNDGHHEWRASKRCNILKSLMPLEEIRALPIDSEAKSALLRDVLRTGEKYYLTPGRPPLGDALRPYTAIVDHGGVLNPKLRQTIGGQIVANIKIQHLGNPNFSEAVFDAAIAEHEEAITKLGLDKARMKKLAFYGKDRIAPAPIPQVATESPVDASPRPVNTSAAPPEPPTAPSDRILAGEGASAAPAETAKEAKTLLRDAEGKLRGGRLAMVGAAVVAAIGGIYVWNRSRHKQPDQQPNWQERTAAPEAGTTVAR